MIALPFALALALGALGTAHGAQLFLVGPRVHLATFAFAAVGLFAWRALPPPRARLAAAPRALWIALAAACALFVAVFAEHTARFPEGAWDACQI